MIGGERIEGGEPRETPSPCILRLKDQGDSSAQAALGKRSTQAGGWGNRSRGKRFLPTSPLWDVVTFSQFLGLGLPQPSFLRCFCLPGSHAPVSEASAFRNRESSEPDPSLLPPFLFLPAPIPFFLNFVYLFIVIRNLSVQRLIGLDLCLRDALVTSSYYNWGTKTTGRPGSPPLGRRAAARMN